MGRHKAPKTCELFTKYKGKLQQFYKIKRVCGSYPSVVVADHYVERYGDKFFAHIYCLHYKSEKGLDKVRRRKK